MRADQLLGALRILDAGQLDDDVVVALPLDDRLGDAELVDAVADRLQRLLDREFADALALRACVSASWSWPAPSCVLGVPIVRLGKRSFTRSVNWFARRRCSRGLTSIRLSLRADRRRSATFASAARA